MEGRKIIKLMSGGPSLEVNTATTKQGEFCVRKHFTYSLATRFLSLCITQMGDAERVNDVALNIYEQNGKASSATLDLHLIGDDRYGILSKISTKFLGSYDSSKDHFWVPPLPATEVFRYLCAETGSAGFLSLEKKVINDVASVYVRSVKATHAFIVGDETVNVNLKITFDAKFGLNVELDEPLRHTREYVSHFNDKMVAKMNREIDARKLAFHSRLVSSPKPNGSQPSYRIIDDGARFTMLADMAGPNGV